jgi:preprotein translocase subunit SecB
MQETPNLPLMIHTQYVRHVSFENPNPIQSLITNESQEGDDPSINVNIQVKANHINERNFEVILEVKSDASRNKETVFDLTVNYGAIVTLNVDEKDIGHYAMVITPGLLFPFVRNIVADLTRNGGFIPLLLNPVDFEALYLNQKDQAQSEPAVATMN